MYRKAVTLMALSLALGSGLAASPQSPPARIVMVVPRSESLIRLGGDVNAFFPHETTLVAFSRRGPLALRVFDVWHHQARRWDSLSLAEWREGRGLPPGPKRLLLIAPESLAEPDVWRGISWAGEMLHIADSDLSAVANRLDALFGFTASQWQSLAERNGLALRDRQERRRRYSRFGPAELRPAPPRPPTRFESLPVAPPPPVVPPSARFESEVQPERMPAPEPELVPDPVREERRPEALEDVGGKAPPATFEPPVVPTPPAAIPRPPPELDAALTLPDAPPERK